MIGTRCLYFHSLFLIFVAGWFMNDNYLFWLHIVQTLPHLLLYDRVSLGWMNE